MKADISIEARNLPVLLLSSKNNMFYTIAPSGFTIGNSCS
jgi:hypothetical protein